jgi:hypothetical protein
MSRIVRTLTAIFGLLLLTSCGLFDSGTLWESGKFSVYWIDTRYNTSLGYDMGSGSRLGVAEPCVFAVGETVKHIAVKRIPKGTPGPPQVILIEKSMYQPTQEGAKALSGPYSEQAYALLARNRHLPALTEIMPRNICGSEA